MGTVSAEGGVFWPRTGRFLQVFCKYRCDRAGFLQKFFRHYVATKKKTPPCRLRPEVFCLEGGV